MIPDSLIPTPDTIPAPVWIFTVLELLTFLLHILVINIVLGGGIILLFKRFKTEDDSLDNSLHGPSSPKLPILTALGINFGVAPLLFVQVLYGNLFYTSSVLMAFYWILIIPLLILAYYGYYIHNRKYKSGVMISKTALLLSVIFILYIGLMLVNNNTLMEQPEKWSAYFTNRTGTILNLGDPILWPRYFHFVTASVAVSGLFLATIWFIRKRRGAEGAESKVKQGLRIFAWGTAVQIAVGLWFLLALPYDIIVQYMGRDIFATVILFSGMAVGISAMVFGFLNKYVPAVTALLFTVTLMVINRYNLRALYLADNFDTSTLTLQPQYLVMALFFLIFIAGLATVGYMLKITYQPKEGRA